MQFVIFWNSARGMKMNKQNRELRRYFKEVKKQTHMYNESSRFLDELKHDIYSYISTNHNVSINNICEKYGTPSELAKEFFHQIDIETYKRKTTITKYVKHIVFICFILFAVLLLGLFIDRQVNQPAVVTYNIKTNS